MSVTRIDVHVDSIADARGEAQRRGIGIVAQVGKDVVVVDPSGRYRYEFRG